MLKQIKYLFFIQLALCMPYAFGTDTSVIENKTSFITQGAQENHVPFYEQNVIKVNDDFYIGQKEPHLWLVMERIDEKVENRFHRKGFWEDFVSNERSAHDLYKKEWAYDSLKNRVGYLMFSDRGQSLVEGIQGFEATMDPKHGFLKNNEVWIAYATPVDPRTLGQSNRSNTSIEMAFTVMTDENAPMVAHMGILRSFEYMLKSLDADKREETNIFRNQELSKEEKETRTQNVKKGMWKENPYPRHQRFSMDLHSFAAKIIALKYPQKQYMITYPVPTMATIMKKALPDGIISEGDTRDIGIKIYESQNKNYSLDKEDLQKKNSDLESEEETVKKEIEKIKKITKNQRLINKLELYLADIRLELKKREKKDFKRLMKRKKTVMKENPGDTTKQNLLIEALKESLDEIEKEIETIREEKVKRGDDEQVAIIEGISPDQTVVYKDFAKKRSTIFDTDRKTILYREDLTEKKVETNGKQFTGDDIKRFAWWSSHPYMSMNPCVVINLKKLASYGKLQGI